MKIKLSVILILIIVLSASCSKKELGLESTTISDAQRERSEQKDNIEYADVNKLKNTFGFTNKTGNLIILQDPLDENLNINLINKAIGESGNILSVRFLKKQERNENDNGRQTSYNFENTDGYIYEVVEGKAKDNETYYLVNDKEFNTKSVVETIVGNYQEIDDAARQEVERAKNRRIADSWELAKVGTEINIYLVLFERQNDDMLASIVMKTPSNIVYRDYPAKYDEGSTWRVDDGGEIDPELFSVLFAARIETGILLGLTWMGAEGESAFLLKENGKELEELEIISYRYMLPI